MRATVVTLSFNQARFLERALLSVLNQDHPDIEYIVIDPGSTDGSRDLLERYRSRLSRLVLEPDRGAADGLNKGLSLATGDIFAFINADDALLQGAITKAVQAFRRFPDADVVHGSGYIVDARAQPLKTVYGTPFEHRRYLLGGVWLLQQACFFRTAAMRDVGGFNPDNHTCWDGELLVAMGCAGRTFRLIPDNLGIFTIHPESITGGGLRQAQYEADHARLVRTVFGPLPAPRFRAMSLASRAGCWLRHPELAVRRLRDAVLGRRLVPPLPVGAAGP